MEDVDASAGAVVFYPVAGMAREEETLSCPQGRGSRQGLLLKDVQGSSSYSSLFQSLQEKKKKEKHSSGTTL